MLRFYFLALGNWPVLENKNERASATPSLVFCIDTASTAFR